MSTSTPSKSPGKGPSKGPSKSASTIKRRATRVAAVAGTVVAVAALTTGTAHAAGPDRTTETTPEQIAPLVQPSVVYEGVTWSGYVYDRFNHQYLSQKPFTVTMQCTGFVVNPDGWIATAGHCVDPKGGKEAIAEQAATWALQNYYDYGNALDVEDVVGDYRVDVVDSDTGRVRQDKVDRAVNVSWGAAVSGLHVERHKPARVVSFQKYDEGDGALIKVEETDLNAIQLADTGDVEINSDAVAIGYPAVIDSFTDPDLTPTYDTGTVSSIKTIGGGLLNVFQLSAELSGGMSGGPTVDADGNVIGVNSSHFVGEPFNYAVPAERITELLGDAGVDNEVSDVTQTYRGGIRAYFAGDRTTAVESLQKVLDEQPQNQLASDFLAKAEKLPKPVEKSDSSRLPWVALAVGVVLAIVVGFTLLVLLLRRLVRRPTPVAPASLTPAYEAAPVAPAAGSVVAEAAQEEPVLVTAGAPEVTTVTAQPLGFVPVPRGQEAPVAHRFCTACGSPVADGQQFCGHCGASRLG